MLNDSRTNGFGKWIAALLMTCNFGSANATVDEVNAGFLENVRHMCKWAKTQAPGNPVSIAACDRGDSDPEQADRDFADWWKYWRDKDSAFADQLAVKWQAELDGRLASQQRAAVAGQRAKIASGLPKMSVEELCKIADGVARKEVSLELAKRGSFSATDLRRIGERKIGLGMSEKALVCAWGEPDDSHRSVGSWGVHTQYIYPDAYVYTENGKVTSWQD